MDKISIPLFQFCLILLTASYSAPVYTQTEENITDFKGFTCEEFSAKDLLNWKSYGLGATEKNHGQAVLYESDGSLGYMLVSPKSYGKNTIVSYDVMALNAATVLITEMAAHNLPGSELRLEDEYDGNVKYLFENVSMYMFAFHNAAHNKTGPFVRKYPVPGANPLAASSTNLMQVGKYYHVEIGMENGQLWFNLDGNRIWNTEDPDAFEGGKVILRVRGTAHEKASCLIRNFKIYSKRSPDSQ